MNRKNAGPGWFQGIDPDDSDAACDAIENGSAEFPADWPTLAVEVGFADNEYQYYSLLHDASVTATRQAIQERERADGQQLVHCIRALDDKGGKLLQILRKTAVENVP